jgi:hypothetical protein
VSFAGDEFLNYGLFIWPFGGVFNTSPYGDETPEPVPGITVWPTGSGAAFTSLGSVAGVNQNGTIAFFATPSSTGAPSLYTARSDMTQLLPVISVGSTINGGSVADFQASQNAIDNAGDVVFRYH